MKNKVILLASLLVSFTLTVGFFSLPKAKTTEVSDVIITEDSNTIWVPDNFTSIQEAINNASDGDTIRVRAGTYHENIVVNKSLTLRGEDRSTTIIDGNKSGNVIKIYGENISLSDFTIQNSSEATYGIWLQDDGSNLIQENSIIHNAGGIYLNYSRHNVIEKNEIFNNIEEGICMSYSRRNRIKGNLIANSKSGILLDHSIFNHIDGNIVENNSWYGIHLEWSWLAGWEGGWGNTITGNTIRNNLWGIYFFASMNNWIYHNNFIGNTERDVTYSPSLIFTHFDNGFEGNYWSNYWGTDLNNDGIGDSPHSFQGHNHGQFFHDNYPLMGLFTGFEIDCEEETFYVFIVSNSEISDFFFNKSDKLIHFNVSRLWGTTGFCRMSIPHFLMDFEKLWIAIDVGETEVLFTNFTVYDNATHRWIYFAYQHSTLEVLIRGTKKPPTISILSPDNKSYPVGDVPLTITISEPASWIGYSLDGQTNVTIVGNITLTTLLDGVHNTTVFANDTAGNMAASSTVYFTIDTAAPDISIILPENKTYPENVFLTFTVDEPTDWIGYSLDGEMNATISGNTTLVLSDGGHTITVYANDTAGNRGYSETVYFTVDAEYPNIEILSPQNKTYTTDYIPLIFAVNKSTSWIGYSLNGAANVTVLGNTTLTDLLDESYYVVMYANDTVGNMGKSTPIYFTVDTTPPNITDVSQTPLEPTPEDKVKVNATTIDNPTGVKQVILNYTNGNGTWITKNMTNLEGNIWNGTIPAYPYGTNVTYVIIAEDNANNTITTEEMGYEYQYHVIPEFPSALILPLLLIVTLVAVVLRKTFGQKNKG